MQYEFRNRIVMDTDKMTLEEFIKHKKDSSTQVMFNDNELFIYTRSVEELLEIINPKTSKDTLCTEE